MTLRCRLFLLTLLATVAAAPARADDAWNALVARAKGQTLVLNQQPDDAIKVILDAFSQKFGITVQATAERAQPGLCPHRHRAEERPVRLGHGRAAAPTCRSTRRRRECWSRWINS